MSELPDLCSFPFDAISFPWSDTPRYRSSSSSDLLFNFPVQFITNNYIFCVHLQ